MTLHSDTTRANSWTPATPAAETREYFTIGEMAHDFNVSLRALRFYEDRELLKPVRHGYVRLYDKHQRERLRLILKGKQLGFTLTGIREMLAERSDAAPVALELALRPSQIVSQIENLERQRSGLDTAIAELKATHERLAQVDTASAAA